MTNIRPRNGFASPVYIKIKDDVGLTVDRNIIHSFDNLTATRDPILADDYSAGYGVGSTWINKNSNSIWVCSNDNVGAAEWINITAQKSFKYDQASPSKIWNVQHNRNNVYYSYTLFDDQGAQVFPDKIETVDSNNIRVTVSVAMAGKLVLQFV